MAAGRAADRGARPERRQPDTSLPPPSPPRPAAATASHAGPMRAAAAPPPSNRTGCIIAVIAIGVLGLFALGILAAIALPAYQDYVKRSKAAQSGQAAPPSAGSQPQKALQKVYVFDAERMAKTDALARELVTVTMREFYAANGNVCPDTPEFEKMMVRYPRYQGSEDGGWFGIDPANSNGSQCAYGVRFYGLGPEVQDKTLRYEVNIAGDAVTIVCRNNDLPSGFLPPNCHVL
jgi:hypothetical protein